MDESRYRARLSMDAYDLHDGRFIQAPTWASAANATALDSAVVPAGKVWSILSLTYYPDVAETRTVVISILARDGQDHPIRIPATIALSPSLRYPGLTEGLELKMYPGESIHISRDVATAGSVMRGRMRMIETDLPYYSYEDPLKKVIAQPLKHGSIFRGARAGGAGGGGWPEGGGGGGSPKPI